jgi:hypothetical protein
MERAKHGYHSTAFTEAFDGEGWTFVTNIYPYGADGDGYAFLRFKSLSPTTIDKEQSAAVEKAANDLHTIELPDLT